MTAEKLHEGAKRRKRLPSVKVHKARRGVLQLKAFKELRSVLQKYSLKLLDEPIDMFTGCQAQNSKHAYEKHWQILAAYCELRGDYESLVIFHPNVPPNSPSVHYKTFNTRYIIQQFTLT